MMAGINMVHVPYRGEAPELTDMLGGQVQAMFGTMPASIEYVRAGKLRPLAVTSARRSELLPDVPTVGEFVPGYEASAVQGVGAPKATPVDIIDKLNREINAALADPKIKSRVADMGGTVLAGSPADFGKFIADETRSGARWSSSPAPSRTNPGQPVLIVFRSVIIPMISGLNATWSAHTENRSMSASLRKRTNFGVAAKCREGP